MNNNEYFDFGPVKPANEDDMPIYIDNPYMRSIESDYYKSDGLPLVPLSDLQGRYVYPVNILGTLPKHNTLGINILLDMKYYNIPNDQEMEDIIGDYIIGDYISLGKKNKNYKEISLRVNSFIDDGKYTKEAREKLSRYIGNVIRINYEGKGTPTEVTIESWYSDGEWNDRSNALVISWGDFLNQIVILLSTFRNIIIENPLYRVDEFSTNEIVVALNTNEIITCNFTCFRIQMP